MTDGDNTPGGFKPLPFDISNSQLMERRRTRCTAPPAASPDGVTLLMRRVDRLEAQVAELQRQVAELRHA